MYSIKTLVFDKDEDKDHFNWHGLPVPEKVVAVLNAENPAPWKRWYVTVLVEQP